MVERDGVYEARWEGSAGLYSVSVVAEDANGNVGESGASRVEIGAGGEPPRVVEPARPAPGPGPSPAGDWRPDGPALPLQTALKQIHAAPDGAWYGRTLWRVWRSVDEGASWQSTSYMLSGRDWAFYPGFDHVEVARTAQGGAHDPLAAYVIEGGGSYGGFRRILSTLDGGATWSPVPIPYGVQAASVDDHLPGRLHAASDGAVFVSDDGGDRWMEFAVEGRPLGVWSHPADPVRTYAWVDSSEGWGGCSGGSTGRARERSAPVPLPSSGSSPFPIRGRRRVLHAPRRQPLPHFGRGSHLAGPGSGRGKQDRGPWLPRTPSPASSTCTPTDSSSAATTAARAGGGPGSDWNGPTKW